MRRIYLDHNAGAPQHPEVTRAVLRCLEAGCGNPSSVHGEGRRARALLEEARGRVASLLGGDPAGVVFTSGATEANNLALRGRVEAAAPGAHLIVTAVEHPSVAAVAEALSRRGAQVTRVPVGGDGRVDPGAVRRAVLPSTALVSIQAANPETGVLQPVAEIAAALAGTDVPLHVDAAQAAGRIPLAVDEMGADLVTLSGHKMGGPRGTGALWIRPGVSLAPLLSGGGQERGFRAGTENVPGAVGLGEAAACAEAGRRRGEVAALRDRLEVALLRFWPGAVAHGAAAPRLPNTTCVGFPGLDGEAAVIRLDLEGIAVSMGSACSTGTMRPSDVLLAMGVPAELARASLRFSLGIETSGEEIDEILAAFVRSFAPGRAAAPAA